MTATCLLTFVANFLNSGYDSTNRCMSSTVWMFLFVLNWACLPWRFAAQREVAEDRVMQTGQRTFARRDGLLYRSPNAAVRYPWSLSLYCRVPRRRPARAGRDATGLVRV